YQIDTRDTKAQKSIRDKRIFSIKDMKVTINPTEKYIFCFLCTFLLLYQKTEILNSDTAPF
ncbi:hypothetical protein, partial [uncultured Duncaniella sp.]|uniref:hypothetical protein n=1 Tax=uncultured Duncaniella sp. TaxID=2768039 RepID=UPI0026495213